MRVTRWSLNPPTQRSSIEPTIAVRVAGSACAAVLWLQTRKRPAACLRGHEETRHYTTVAPQRAELEKKSRARASRLSEISRRRKAYARPPARRAPSVRVPRRATFEASLQRERQANIEEPIDGPAARASERLSGS